MGVSVTVALGFALFAKLVAVIGCIIAGKAWERAKVAEKMASEAIRRLDALEQSRQRSS